MTTWRWRTRFIPPAAVVLPERWWSRRWWGSCRAGRQLTALKELGDKVKRATRSMGVALTSCTVPAAGKPTFAIGDSEMEMGVGIHGEPGRRRVALRTANEIAEEMVAAIAGDLGAKGDALALRQRLRRHAGDGALPHVSRRRGAAGEARHQAGASLVAAMSPRSTWRAARSPSPCWMTQSPRDGMRPSTPLPCAGACRTSGGRGGWRARRPPPVAPRSSGLRRAPPP